MIITFTYFVIGSFVLEAYSGHFMFWTGNFCGMFGVLTTSSISFLLLSRIIVLSNPIGSVKSRKLFVLSTIAVTMGFGLFCFVIQASLDVPSLPGYTICSSLTCVFITSKSLPFTCARMVITAVNIVLATVFWQKFHRFNTMNLNRAQEAQRKNHLLANWSIISEMLFNMTPIVLYAILTSLKIQFAYLPAGPMLQTFYSTDALLTALSYRRVILQNTSNLTRVQPLENRNQAPNTETN
ncbi:hypothetical protein M3Y96_00560100 [Aphelenchoides besseyi]|nr:hypothetical protein M3Y96_00560100 [Aphelenchoides besseyi]